MQRHSAWAYLLSAIELPAASLLLLGSWVVGQAIVRVPRSANLDDWLGLAAMAIAGAAFAVAGAATLGHSRLSYPVIRGAHLAAAASGALTMAAGAGMWAVARHRGGDWVGLGVLSAFVVLSAGGLLLALSLIGLRILRKKPDSAR